MDPHGGKGECRADWVLPLCRPSYTKLHWGAAWSAQLFQKEEGKGVNTPTLSGNLKLFGTLNNWQHWAKDCGQQWASKRKRPGKDKSEGWCRTESSGSRCWGGQRKRGREKSRECGEIMEERGREILGGKMKKVKQSVKRRRTRRRCWGGIWCLQALWCLLSLI